MPKQNAWKSCVSIDFLLSSSFLEMGKNSVIGYPFPSATIIEVTVGRSISSHDKSVSLELIRNFVPFMQYAQSASNIISLAEHLGTSIYDHVPETPNKLSEDMIKCMSAIYCKLSDPPLTHNGLSSPNSSLSSMSAFSPREQCDMWSPGFRNNPSFDVRLDNPFLVEGLKEFSGPYSTMIEVPWIYRDSQKLGDVENLLQNFRLVVLPFNYYQKTC